MTTSTVEAWITWGALGAGVYKATGVLVEMHKGTWFRPDVVDGGRHQMPPGDYHLTEAEALAKVRKMIKAEVRRIARITKALGAMDAAAKTGTLPMRKPR